MTALSELFPDGPRADKAGGAVLDDHHTARRLREMIGEPTGDGASPRQRTGTHELVDMVEAAVRTATPIAASSEAAERSVRRRRLRVDPLAFSVSALAVVALATAATVGGIQMATASPASSALESLEADEASVQNAHQSLKAARDRLVADVDAQTAEIAQLRSTLTATAAVPDPAGEPGSATLAVSDAAALEAALAALDLYEAGLAAITVPALPAAYTRGAIDEDSLAAVGAAIDSVQEWMVVLDEAAATVRAQRMQLDGLRPPADLAVSAYAASLPVAATEALTRYPDAEESLRTAATEGAALVAATSLWSAEGRATLIAYADALGALAADQLRVEIEREQTQESREPRRRQNGTQDGAQSPPPGGSTSPAPVDPVTPVDPVDPVDPETPPEDAGGTP